LRYGLLLGWLGRFCWFCLCWLRCSRLRGFGLLAPGSTCGCGPRRIPNRATRRIARHFVDVVIKFIHIIDQRSAQGGQFVVVFDFIAIHRELRQWLLGLRWLDMDSRLRRWKRSRRRNNWLRWRRPNRWLLWASRRSLAGDEDIFDATNRRAFFVAPVLLVNGRRRPWLR